MIATTDRAFFGLLRSMSPVAIYSTVVADAVQQYRAGELDQRGLVAVLLRQGYTVDQAAREAAFWKVQP